MSQARRAVRGAQGQGDAVARSSQFEWLARSGLIARGAIYAIVGILAVKLALGDAGGSTTSQQGALREIAQQPFGKALLIATAVGLAGYSIWRIVRAAIGHGPEASDGAVERIGGLISGVGYGILCVAAVEILLGSGSSGGGTSSTTSGVLGWTGGVWIVGIAGVLTIAEGLDQGYKGVSEKFLEKSKTSEMSETVKRWFTRVGTFGHLARMVVFVLIGYFLLQAAIDYNPDEAITLDGALAKVAQASYGPILLGIVACGLIGFGVYSLLDARYRKI
ncbi:MAG: DUF1206 domain-containing protein [Solirubrobacterales bacterium]|nr:DUF1206 domain-containing protein [Solirubrobacterales bacterium]